MYGMGSKFILQMAIPKYLHVDTIVLSFSLAFPVSFGAVLFNRCKWWNGLCLKTWYLISKDLNEKLLHFCVSGIYVHAWWTSFVFFSLQKISNLRCNELDFHLSFGCYLFPWQGECIYCNKFRLSMVLMQDAQEYFNQKPWTQNRISLKQKQYHHQHPTWREKSWQLQKLKQFRWTEANQVHELKPFIGCRFGFFFFSLPLHLFNLHVCIVYGCCCTHSEIFATHLFSRTQIEGNV